jgi:hypothetical protein
MEEHKLQFLVYILIIVIAYESRRTQAVTTPSHIKIKEKKAGKSPKMLHRITQSSHGFPIPTLHKHKTKQYIIYV